MSSVVRGPRTVIRTSSPGISCLCCSCLTCLHLSFLKTPPGLFKISEMILGSFCQSLLLQFGASYSLVLGASYTSLLTSVTASLSTVSLLLLCYILSETSYGLIRSSFFETLFNVSAGLSYLSSSVYLGVAVNLYLYPLYLVTLGFLAYPAMIGAYILGFILGVVHLVDGWKHYRYFKGYR